MWYFSNVMNMLLEALQSKMKDFTLKIPYDEVVKTAMNVAIVQSSIKNIVIYFSFDTAEEEETINNFLE